MPARTRTTTGCRRTAGSPHSETMAGPTRPVIATPGRVGTAILSECGEPAVRLTPVAVLERTVVVWPDLDLHVAPPVEPAVSAVAPQVTCPATGACTGRMTGRRRRAPVCRAPALPTRHTRSCRAARQARNGGLPPASAWSAPVYACRRCGCPPPYQSAPGSPSVVYESTVSTSNHDLIYLR